MDGVDKEKVQRIVYEMSKGSKYFENEERKEAETRQKIERMRARCAKLTSVELTQYQMVLQIHISSTDSSALSIIYMYSSIVLCTLAIRANNFNNVFDKMKLESNFICNSVMMLLLPCQLIAIYIIARQTSFNCIKTICLNVKLKESTWFMDILLLVKEKSGHLLYIFIVSLLKMNNNGNASA